MHIHLRKIENRKRTGLPLQRLGPTPEADRGQSAVMLSGNPLGFIPLHFGCNHPWILGVIGSVLSSTDDGVFWPRDTQLGRVEAQEPHRFG
jgi:hypothetical protein